MLPNGRRLGAHLPLGHGMLRAADRAAQIHASAIQVFTDNPTSWRRRPTLPRDLPAFRDRLAADDVVPLAIHAPYLVNLAGPNPDAFDRSVAVLVNELRVAASWGAQLVNVHLGSHRGAGVDGGIAGVAAGLRRVFDEVDGAAAGVTLVLENGAGGGSGIGVTIDELARVESAVVGAGVGRERFGYCLDMAHLWGAGYAIDDPARVDEVIAEFDAAIGLARLRMVHLNDSRSDRGSRTDQHEHLGAGRIGAAGLRRVVTHPGLAHVAYLLETPGMDDGYDLVNMDRARDLAEGRPLAELPPDAFDTPSTKGRSAPPEDDLALEPAG